MRLIKNILFKTRGTLDVTDIIQEQGIVNSPATPIWSQAEHQHQEDRAHGIGTPDGQFDERRRTVIESDKL